MQKCNLKTTCSSESYTLIILETTGIKLKNEIDSLLMNILKPLFNNIYDEEVNCLTNGPTQYLSLSPRPHEQKLVTSID